MTNSKTRLFNEAKTTRENSYSPYSKFKVGASILTNKDNIYSGCNVENASYSVCTCAEENAISTMVANGETTIKELLVITDTETGSAPCGACRQRILEFSNNDTIIHIANTQEITKSIKMTDLIPHSFSKEDLK